MEAASREETVSASVEPATTGKRNAKCVSDGEMADKPESRTNPSLARQILVVLGLALATLAMSLDGTIIVSAIPKITTEFQSLNDVGWYGSAYFLLLVTIQPIYGKFYKLLRVKYVFGSSILLFVVGSIICAAAKRSYVFIIGRAVAGSGAAGILSGSMIIASQMASPKRKPIYIGMLSGVYSVGFVVGPILGGVFTQVPALTWRFCFWINLPLSGFTCGVVFFCFRTGSFDNREKITTRELLRQIDIPGTTLLMTALVCLLLALQWGGSTYLWSNSRVWGCLLGFFLLLLAFGIVEYKKNADADRIVAFSILRKRTVVVSCIFAVFFTMTVRTHVFYLPIFFQVIQDFSPIQSGVHLLPYLCGTVVAPFVSGVLISKLKVYRPFILVGSALLAIGSGLIFMLKASSTTGFWVGCQILAGIGTGLCMQIPFTAVQKDLIGSEIPTGVSLIAFSNGLGPTIAVSVAQNLFINYLTQGLNRAGIESSSLIESGAQSLQSLVTPQQLPQATEAYMFALGRTFAFAIATSICGFIVALFLRSSSKGQRETPTPPQLVMQKEEVSHGKDV